MLTRRKAKAASVVTTPAKKRGRKMAAKKDRTDIAASYNKFKNYGGKQYTGMAVGRSHKWYYDKGVWKETKITPDEWGISYAVTKRRAGKAPEGSGAAVGTEYNWFILAHQHVKKLDANSYSTELKGAKFKIAHKRAGKEKWSISELTQKKHLLKVLEAMAEKVRKEIESANPSQRPVGKNKM